MFARGSNGTHRGVFEYRLTEVLGAEIRGRGRRHVLEVTGESFRHRVERPVTVTLAELQRRLASA